MKREVLRQPLTIALTALVAVEGSHGKSRRKVGERTGTVVIEIDAEALFREYGARALRSRGRRACVAKGGVLVRALNCSERSS